MSDETPGKKEEGPAAKKRAPHPPRTSQGSDPDRALLALLFFALFALGCYFLVQRLRRDSQIQDCVMSGRRNCDPDATPAWDR